jgi:hypothetical protein
MTLTETTKNIEFNQEYSKQNESVISLINKRKTANENLEKIFEKFTEEMRSVSTDFTLVKTERTQEFQVFVKEFPINSHTLTYYYFDIKYTGKLPDGVSSNSIWVDVSEHHVYRRGSWKSCNEGYKIKTKINYEESPYYKTGRTAAKKIIEHVENLFYQSELKKQKNELNNRAFKELSKQFPYKFIRIIGERNGNQSIFIIENPNNTKITVRYDYNPSIDVINFIVENVGVQVNINLGYLVEKLGNI